MNNKISAFVVALAFAAGLISCKGENKPTTESGTEAKTETAAPEAVGKMDDFFKMLDGTTAGSAKAFNTYATKGLKDYNGNACMPDFCDYELKDPKVISQQGICSTIETKAGITIRTYKICWLNDSISGIDFVGMK